MSGLHHKQIPFLVNITAEQPIILGLLWLTKQPNPLLA